MIRQLSTLDADFLGQLTQLLHLPDKHIDAIHDTVKTIIRDVRKNGDKAVLALTNKFDRTTYAQASELEVSRDAMQPALARVEPLVLDALKTSIERVQHYHEKQKAALGGGDDWFYKDALGNQLGQRIQAMQRIGVYVPGGKASYPSSLVMAVIPAKVAGVAEIILAVPTPDKALPDLMLAAAYLCSVDKLYKVGGAQAIAAMAYGTDIIPRVDKIVGPGNIFVATAKKMVFGDVGIDMIAGPSEIVILADESANPHWLAMDMLAQAEHDELAQAILISSSASVLAAVKDSIEKHLPHMQRSGIIAGSLVNRGGLILTSSAAEAVAIVNQIAPEHLQLALQNPERLLADIRFAGAIFIGHHSAEVIGDYAAGPSHVLPTNGSARFASTLGVYDFQIRSSLINCSTRGAISLSRAAAIIAEQEGLEAHSKSAGLRIRG